MNEKYLVRIKHIDKKGFEDYIELTFNDLSEAAVWCTLHSYTDVITKECENYIIAYAVNIETGEEFNFAC